MTIKIAHLINLGKVGGIERNYSQFINCRIDTSPVSHHTILTKNRIAEPLMPLIRKGSASISSVKRTGPLKIPHWPSVLRYYHCNRILSKMDPDIIILWSNPTVIDLHRLRTDAKVYYYERGAVWFNRSFKGLDRQFEKVDGIICNSFASKRMLQLKWGIDAKKIRIDICLNAVRPDSFPNSIQPKAYHGDRPFRLGIAGRMEPVKGFALALHALKALTAKGLPCELLVCGTGGEMKRMVELSSELKLDQSVTFLGFVNDMAQFYSRVDCFICPSIREPFGLVCAEAMANGCPVIATRVDGLPEVVNHMETGFCITPTLSIDHYAHLGGRTDSIPRFVYNPSTDQIEAPRLLDPDMIAQAVETLLSDTATYHRMSQTAISMAEHKFDFSRHVRKVLRLLNVSFHGNG